MGVSVQWSRVINNTSIAFSERRRVGNRSGGAMTSVMEKGSAGADFFGYQFGT